MPHAKISRGNHKGKILTPHKHEDGMYVATTSRFEGDYVRVESIDELIALIQSGYGARMSNSSTGNAPSYIVNKNIVLNQASDSDVNKSTKMLKKSILESEFDSETRAKNRKEQSLLRALLLGNKSKGECIICQKEFPFDLLIAAHLKMRSECTDLEKADIDNIAALMCKTGCDDFYEKGYISIKDGKVVSNKRATTPAVNEVLEKLTGNSVKNWHASSKYYDWHHNKFNK